MKYSLKNIFPDHIRNIAVTSPAGRPDMEQLKIVIGQMRSAGIGIVNCLPEASPQTPHYLAADAADRLKKFNQAVNDPAVDMIICARGGFGCVHLLDQIDYTTLQERNLPVMGYSDITALHCAMLKQKAGMAIAGSNLVTLDRVAEDDFSYLSHRAALDINSAPVILPEAPQALQAVYPENFAGEVSGNAYAANLTVLTSLCGTGFMPDFSNMILILEDVNEPVYKLDRMLEQLRCNGVFADLKALGFGIFSGIDDNRALTMLQQRIAGNLTCPVFCGFQFGHTYPMCAVNSQRFLTLRAGQRIRFSN
ncbi:MAG: LD-carboxypeptidase [Lentisphaerae bacterium]|nr:LD-carboxypeptidase [Lentisphaerota bacterium]